MKEGGEGREKSCVSKIVEEGKGRGRSKNIFHGILWLQRTRNIKKRKH